MYIHCQIFELAEEKCSNMVSNMYRLHVANKSVSVCARYNVCYTSVGYVSDKHDKKNGKDLFCQKESETILVRENSCECR